MGTGAMAPLPVHRDLQLPGSRRQATAADADRSGRQVGHDMHAEQSIQPLHRSGIAHPDRPLGEFFGRLEQQAHPGGQPVVGRQQTGHPKTDAGVQIVPAGMHHPLMPGGMGQPGAFLHRQSIHVNAQPNGGAMVRTQFRKHTRAADPFTHTPAGAPQFTSHQSSGLVLFTAQFRMGMQMTPQLDQLGKRLGQQIEHGHRLSSARKAIRSAVGTGGQRRICSSHSPSR